MRSKLFITFCTVVLTGFSVAAYGATSTNSWVWFSKDGDITRPSGKIAQADCLETICEYGCVEKNGEYGYCCPGNGQCRVDGANVDLCCTEGEFCDKGHCCPIGAEWDGNQCCLDVGCGCNVAKINGCCPGVVKGCDGVCGSGKTDTGCGCGITDRTWEGCCPGQVKGCDGKCGSGKTDVGCGCGVAKVNGCCPGVVKGCDGVCGSGKTNTGCGCGVSKTWEGCCPGKVKGCDGVCGSGKTDVGCGCGVSKTWEGCCPGQVKDCAGVCGGTAKDVGCGCGKTCSQKKGALIPQQCPNCSKN